MTDEQKARMEYLETEVGKHKTNYPMSHRIKPNGNIEKRMKEIMPKAYERMLASRDKSFTMEDFEKWNKLAEELSELRMIANEEED